MNILRIDFLELYRRHLCRHGQFGINFWHILAVYGVYFSICSLAVLATRSLSPGLLPMQQSLVLLMLFAPWLAVVLRNVPPIIMVFTLLSTAALIAAAVLCPQIPFWAHILLIPAWHRVQLISHRYYTLHRDMSAFDEKYRKGFTLFVLLAVYELPILLQYLVCGRRDWVR